MEEAGADLASWYGQRQPQQRQYRLANPYRVHGEFSGLLAQGNLDLSNRPAYQHPDDSVSSVYSMGQEVDGREMLLPGVSERGKMLTPDQSLAEYLRTGNHLGAFDSPDASNRYAEALHLQQEQNGPSGKFGPQGLDRNQYYNLIAAMSGIR